MDEDLKEIDRRVFISSMELMDDCAEHMENILEEYGYRRETKCSDTDKKRVNG